MKKDLKQDLSIGESQSYLATRSNFKTFIPKSLLRAVLYLYDLNVRTFSCGDSAGSYGFGISIDYDCLSDENKKIANKFMKDNAYKLIEPFSPHTTETNFRIFVDIDINKTSIEEADKAIYEQVLKVGLKKQDMLYGHTSLKQQLEEYRKAFEGVSDDDLIDVMKEQGKIIVDGEVWFCEEFYNKHIEYLNELEKQRTETLNV